MDKWQLRLRRRRASSGTVKDYNESKTRKRDVMEDDFEDRWKRKEKDTRL